MGEISGSCTKQQEKGTQGVLKGDQIFKSAEAKKDHTYLKKCNDNNIRFITAAVTREGAISSTTQQLLDFMAAYGSKNLKRNTVQIAYFQKLFTTAIVKNQSIILNKKIDALSVLQEKKINNLLKEITAFIEEDTSAFPYRFPFEIESVPNENTTDVDFRNNLNEDNDTDIDELNDFHNNINNNNSINTLDSIDTLSDPG